MDRAVVVRTHVFITLEHSDLMATNGKLVGKGLNRHLSPTCAVIIVIKRE
jgi:hypothetical protein